MILTSRPPKGCQELHFENDFFKVSEERMDEDVIREYMDLQVVMRTWKFILSKMRSHRRILSGAVNGSNIYKIHSLLDNEGQR